MPTFNFRPIEQQDVIDAQAVKNTDEYVTSGQIDRADVDFASQFTFQETTADSMINNASKWYFKSLDKIVSTVQKTVKWPQAPIGTDLRTVAISDSWSETITTVANSSYLVEYIDSSGYYVSTVLASTTSTLFTVTGTTVTHIAVFKATDLMRYDNLILRDDGTYFITQTEGNLFDTQDSTLNFTSNLYSIVDGSDTATSVTFTYDVTTEEYSGSDGYKYITVGSSARFNQGAYHPVYNKYGTAKFGDALPWYSSTDAKSSIYDCFTTVGNGSLVGAASGRPDGKFYDVIYNEVFIDQRFGAKAQEAGKELTTVERDKDISATQRADFVGSATWETTNQFDVTINGHSELAFPTGQCVFLTAVASSNIEKFGLYNSIDDDSIGFVQSQSGRYYEIDHIYNSGANDIIRFVPRNDTAAVISDFVDTNTYKIIIAKKSNFCYGSTTYLHTDIISDPANWPKGHDYTNTGATQTVDLAIGDIVYLTDATPVGTGVTGNFYETLVDLASQDISLLDYGNASNFKNLGTSTGKGWFDVLAGGGTIDGVPLLVGEKGEDLIPDGTSKVYKYSHKLAGALNGEYGRTYTTDSGVTWVFSVIVAGDAVTNSLTVGYTSHVVLTAYKAYNNNLAPIVNLPVEKGSAGISDIFATQHSLATVGNKLLPSLLGKIGVSNTVPSRIEGISIDRYGAFYGDTKFYIDAISIPFHKESILLGNLDSPATKLFSYLNQGTRAKQVYVFKEMYFDNTQDIVQYIDAGVAFSAVVGETFILRGFTNSALNGMTIEFLTATATTWAATIFDGHYVGSDSSTIYTSTGTIYTTAKIWGGNGFGDNNKFNIVDNVLTTTDDNGNVILIGQKSRLYHSRIK